MSTPGKPPPGSASLDAGASWDERRSHAHSVQFYEDDDFLLDALSRFIGAALLAGDSALVIATKSHRAGLARRLTSRGLDLAPAITRSRYLSLDAAETLSTFMMDSRMVPVSHASLAASLRNLERQLSPNMNIRGWRLSAKWWHCCGQKENG